MMDKIKLEELTLDNIGDWPNAIKFVLLGVINFLLCIVLYQFFLQTQLQQLNIVQIEKDNLRQVLLKQQQQLSQNELYKNQVKRLQQSWLNKTQQLSSPNQVADLLADITRVGMTNGLQFKSVRPLLEQPSNAQVLPVEIYVQGEYPQLSQFMLQLSALKQSIGLRNFVLTKNEASSQLTLKLNLDIYREDSDQNNLESNKDSALSSQQNPFQSSTKENGAENLSSFAIDTLHMVGYLQQGAKQWALLAAANEHVYHVTTGDEVGRHHGMVSKIASSQIEITEQEMGQSKNLILKIHQSAEQK